jgi:putative transcriptional regulator
MTISHHPSDETLQRYAAGRLTAGPSLVVAVHLEGCPRCRRWVGDLEIIGGILLGELPPTPVSPEALSRALARLDQPVGEPSAVVSRPRSLDGIPLPQALETSTIMPWRWFGPGMHWSRVCLPHAPEANVVLFRIAASRRLPVHGHTGIELTQVLSGSFSDSSGRFQAGDVEEADGAVEHQPIVDGTEACICLAAVEGRMRLNGFIAPLMQRVLGL